MPLLGEQNEKAITWDSEQVNGGNREGHVEGWASHGGCRFGEWFTVSVCQWSDTGTVVADSNSQLSS